MEDPYTASRIILVEPHDPKQYWKKVLEILTVVDRDLGLSDMDISNYQSKKVKAYTCTMLLSILSFNHQLIREYTYYYCTHINISLPV